MGAERPRQQRRQRQRQRQQQQQQRPGRSLSIRARAQWPPATSAPPDAAPRVGSSRSPACPLQGGGAKLWPCAAPVEDYFLHLMAGREFEL